MLQFLKGAINMSGATSSVSIKTHALGYHIQFSRQRLWLSVSIWLSSDSWTSTIYFILKFSKSVAHLTGSICLCKQRLIWVSHSSSSVLINNLLSHVCTTFLKFISNVIFFFFAVIKPLRLNPNTVPWHSLCLKVTPLLDLASCNPKRLSRI